MTLAGKTIVFRVDASLLMGAGHVMRCLTAADALRHAHADVHFVCRELDGNLIGFLQSRHYPVHALPAPAPAGLSGYAEWLGVTQEKDAADTRTALATLTPDVIVVDHYGLDSTWENAIQSRGGHIVVIDDLANRPHECSLLLDQNLGKTRTDYLGLVPQQCQILAGPAYALLRPEFAELRAASLARRHPFALRSLLISMGGIDKDNVTRQILAQLEHTRPAALEKVTIVMGRNAPWKDDVIDYASHLPFDAQVVVDVSDMARLMMEADLAIGAAGGTAWERCCLGLPSLIVVLADNQAAGATALCRTGAAMLAGTPADIADNLPRCIQQLDTPGCMQAMSLAASQVTDGRGTRLFLQSLETL